MQLLTELERDLQMQSIALMHCVTFGFPFTGLTDSACPCSVACCVLLCSGASQNAYNELNKCKNLLK